MQTPPTPISLAEWLDLAEQGLDDAERGLRLAGLLLSSFSEDRFAEFSLSECDLGQLHRRAERLRQRRARILAVPTDQGDLIKVRELAAAITRTEHTTRALLESGAIPYAQRKTPGQKNSPWLIPRASVAAFLRGAS